MRNGRLLTLSMTETKKNNYQIIGYLYDTFELVVFSTNRYKDNNRYLLDIGAISNIQYKPKYNENEIDLIGDIVLDKYLTKNELYEFLYEQCIDFSKFKRQRTETFGVIKINTIEEIIINNNEKLDSKLVLIANGVKEKVRIKDYRWLSYWNYIYQLNNKEKMKERIEYYKKFFNSKETYVILFRLKNKINNTSNNRFIKNNDIYWISGIFYI